MLSPNSIYYKEEEKIMTTCSTWFNKEKIIFIRASNIMHTTKFTKKWTTTKQPPFWYNMSANRGSSQLYHNLILNQSTFSLHNEVGVKMPKTLQLAIFLRKQATEINEMLNSSPSKRTGDQMKNMALT